MKILSVIGTRPEAIKMAPVIIKLNNEKKIEHRVCATAQHREMLDEVLSIFKIKPSYDLNLMSKNQTLHELSAKILIRVKKILDEYSPDIVLVQGDTSTAFIGALSAFYSGIKIGHIEAGLRSGNMNEPFPEESNRVFISKITDFHFAPTKKNADVLIKEGVNPKNILKTGNTVIDALLHVADRQNNITKELKKYKSISNVLKDKKQILLITAHRRENFGKGIAEICEALKKIAKKYKNLQIIYPVHPNPNIKNKVFEKLNNIKNIHLINPLSYTSFVYLMKKSTLILSDSGGVQEEAPSLGKPVLVLRSVTERVEAVKSGTVKLIGTKKEKIINEVSVLLENKHLSKKMSQAINPYGDGTASKKIVDFLKTLC